MTGASVGNRRCPFCVEVGNGVGSDLAEQEDNVMKRLIAATLAAATMGSLAACSEQTQQDAAETADLAGDDIEANAAVVGEVLEDGAKEAAGAVSEGAADLQRELEEGDTETPGPAPITGSDLNSDREDPAD